MKPAPCEILMLISSEFVALALGLAGMSWLFYAWSQQGRRQAMVLSWLAVPFFSSAMTYIWFTFADVDIEIRAMYARYGFVSIGMSHAIILFLLFMISRGENGKRI